MNSGLTDYDRCPDKYGRMGLKDGIPSTSGYFRFGPESICYGSYHRQQQSLRHVESLPDALQRLSLRMAWFTCPSALPKSSQT